MYSTSFEAVKLVYMYILIKYYVQTAGCPQRPHHKWGGLRGYRRAIREQDFNGGSIQAERRHGQGGFRSADSTFGRKWLAERDPLGQFGLQLHGPVLRHLW